MMIVIGVFLFLPMFQARIGIDINLFAAGRDRPAKAIIQVILRHRRPRLTAVSQRRVYVGAGKAARGRRCTVIGKTGCCDNLRPTSYHMRSRLCPQPRSSTPRLRSRRTLEAHVVTRHVSGFVQTKRHCDVDVANSPSRAKRREAVCLSLEELAGSCLTIDKG